MVAQLFFFITTTNVLPFLVCVTTITKIVTDELQWNLLVVECVTSSNWLYFSGIITTNFVTTGERAHAQYAMYHSARMTHFHHKWGMASRGT